MGILTFIIVLGVLIFVHEFGHFYFAKRAGVGVEKFSIGFGPRIFSFRRGETLYQVALIPLGGFVKMMGDNPDEPSTGSEKEYLSRPVRDRMPIVLAGPVVNLIVAFLLMPVVYMLGVQVPAFISQPPVVGYVTPETPAAAAGIQAGDHITAIDGKPMGTWEDLLASTLAEPNKRIEVAVERNGATERMPVELGQADNGAALFGVQPPAETVIAHVQPGSPAAEGGIVKGDRVVALNGEPVSHWVDMAERIQAHGAEPMQVGIERAGEVREITLTPRVGDESGRVVLGIQKAEELELQRYGFFESIGEGVSRMGQMTVQTFQILGKLVTGQLSMKALGGPIRIAQATSVAAESGLADVLSLMAFLSLQLGILNLLPFPVLDGGHVLFMSIEAIRRRPLSRRALEISNQVGFVLLLVLMVFVTKNDIMYTWGPSIESFFDKLF